MNGLLIVVSAPSGAGKTTLSKMLMKEFPNLKQSVSHTTRPLRENETHGKDYFFVSKEEFSDMLQRDELLEWATVHGNLYGTSTKYIRKALNNKEDILLDIDVQGVRKLQGQEGIPAIYVFISPSKISTLEKRLSNRPDKDVLDYSQRISNAKDEVKEFGRYDHIIINDDLNQALQCFKKIYLASKTSRLRYASYNEFIDLGDETNTPIKK